LDEIIDNLNNEISEQMITSIFNSDENIKLTIDQEV
jgi:hypothetical protein